MNIADLFDQMEGNSPKRYGMSGAQFAAFLLCNPKQSGLPEYTTNCIRFSEDGVGPLQ
jgi:hypothetical protein